MLGNIGNLFVKVTKGNQYHLFEVLHYYIMDRERAQSVLLNDSRDHRWVTVPIRGFFGPL